MNEDTFWTMIDEAWAVAAPELESKRRELATEADVEERETLAEEVEGFMDAMVDVLRERLNELSSEQLLAFDRVLERKLYDIDREEVHRYTDGLDDGFLYCRGFIVGVGRAYYEAVARDPSKAVFDMECELLTYLPFRMIHDKFGEAAWTASEINRETCSNIEGWTFEEDDGD